MNFLKPCILLIFILFVNMKIFAGPGDTITVQTIEFEGFPHGEGWLAPREGYFDFSAIEGKTFAKVLMYYTLKCNSAQSPACGEWDYLSYSKVLEHTGFAEFPNFYHGGLGGYTPENFSFMNLTSWNYAARKEEKTIYSNPLDKEEFAIGSGIIDDPNTFNNSLKGNRNFYLWKSDELTTAGLTAGNITGLQFNFNSISDSFQKLRIRLKNSTLSNISADIDTTGFTTVYFLDTEITSTGWNTLTFSEPFYWDGTSNLLIDISFIGNSLTSQNSVLSEELGWNCGLNSLSDNNYLDFLGPDAIYIPVENLSEIQNEITITFRQNGNTDLQPQPDCIFEAINAEGKRVFNVHLPWDNGTVYWDAGNSTGWDRVEKALQSYQYEGQWNYWAFTKNVTNSTMKIYLNGTLLVSGTGKNRVPDIIDSMAIGRGLSDLTPSNLRFYAGKIDEFQIWDKELDAATISDWMFKKIDSSHPNFSNLKAYYSFDENNLFSTYDEITAQNVTLNGIPQRMNYNNERFTNFTVTTKRPNIIFNRNNSTFTSENQIVVDSFPKGIEMIEKYIQLQPNERPVLDEVLYVYPTYYNNYVFDENGNALDSTYVMPDETLTLQMFTFASTIQGEEIINNWELGRFITPYGNNLDLGSDGWTWIYDVTDFQSLLKGENVHIAAGNFQELLDLKFKFIEGTPPRDFIEIQKVWNGDFNLSNFDEKVSEKNITLNSEGEMFKLRTCLTGHGFGTGNNCGEFCENTHSVNVNGNQEFSWEILQECADNPLYPQGGTWIYDRAGWCPGMAATVQNLEITPFIGTEDSEVNLDYDIEYDPYGNYVTETFFVTYGTNNFSYDAEIEDIVAPNIFKQYNRFNPICGNPIIKIKNNGSEVLTSLTIEYGIYDKNIYTYNWTGELSFLESEEVVLPTIPLEEFKTTESFKFQVEIYSPNSQEDEYIYNNASYSEFTLVPIYPEDMVINFYTNNRPYENEYKIFDTEGNIVFEKSEFSAATVYNDTISLLPGCYEFVLYDTGGDGIYSWPTGQGTGYIKLYDTDENLLINLQRWFGNYIRHNFVVEEFTSNIENVKIVNSEIKIVPNPSNGNFRLQFYVDKISDYEVFVYDLYGKIVFNTKIYNQGVGEYSINMDDCLAGVYFVKITSSNFSNIQKIIIH